MLSGHGPIFQQVAERLADDIINGTFAEDAAVPSTNDYAAFYQISPITAAKGLATLVDAGVLYKKRGVGMFVATGARETLLRARRTAFREEHIAPLLREARLLGIDPDDLIDMIHQEEIS